MLPNRTAAAMSNLLDGRLLVDKGALLRGISRDYMRDLYSTLNLIDVDGYTFLMAASIYNYDSPEFEEMGALANNGTLPLSLETSDSDVLLMRQDQAWALPIKNIRQRTILDGNKQTLHVHVVFEYGNRLWEITFDEPEWSNDCDNTVVDAMIVVATPVEPYEVMTTMYRSVTTPWETTTNED